MTWRGWGTGPEQGVGGSEVGEGARSQRHTPTVIEVNTIHCESPEERWPGQEGLPEVLDLGPEQTERSARS